VGNYNPGYTHSSESLQHHPSSGGHQQTNSNNNNAPCGNLASPSGLASSQPAATGNGIGAYASSNASSPHSDSVPLTNKGQSSTNNNKLFHTRTYNHIKDMISSRFGSSLHNGSATTNGVKPPSSIVQLNNMPNMVDVTQQVPIAVSSYTSQYSNAANGNNVPSSYKSPNMSERKNVNTSFRKAIQKSTQKSNLSAEVAGVGHRRIASIGEASNEYNNGISSGNSNPMVVSTAHVELEQAHEQIFQSGVERAQRALDKLIVSENSNNGNNNPAGGIMKPGTYGRAMCNGNSKLPPAYSCPPEASPHLKVKFSSASPVVKPGLGSSSSSNRVGSEQCSPQEPLISGFRENGDGSSGSMEHNNGNGLPMSELRKISGSVDDMKHLGILTGQQNLSSSSECEQQGKRVGSGQSHTTDSGLGGSAHNLPMGGGSSSSSSPHIHQDGKESGLKMRGSGKFDERMGKEMGK